MLPAMSTQRFLERSADFTRAAQRLEEACMQPFSSYVRDSVIQRFEFSWELAWKVLKLRLEALGVEVLSPRDAFQEGLAKGLLHDGNAWSRAQKMRNLTSHTYDEKLADEVYHYLLNEGRHLFSGLSLQVREWVSQCQS